MSTTFGTVSVVLNGRGGQQGVGVASVWTSWVQSPHGPWQFCGPFVGYICVSTVQKIKISTTNMYIAWARTQFEINTGVEINTTSFHMGCQLFSAASAPPLELCFWHSPCGLEWACCLSLVYFWLCTALWFRFITAEHPLFVYRSNDATDRQWSPIKIMYQILQCLHHVVMIRRRFKQSRHPPDILSKSKGTSTTQNFDKPKRRQNETSTNRNLDKPKRRQT